MRALNAVAARARRASGRLSAMRRAPLLPALALAALAGCPSPGAEGPQLWIAIDRNEGAIRLLDVEPDPF